MVLVGWSLLLKTFLVNSFCWDFIEIFGNSPKFPLMGIGLCGLDDPDTSLPSLFTLLSKRDSFIVTWGTGGMKTSSVVISMDSSLSFISFNRERLICLSCFGQKEFVVRSGSIWRFWLVDGA